MNDTRAVHDLLATDPLAHAERITGQSYKDDESTMGLGLLLHLDHSARKRAVLEAARDTHYGISLDDALDVFADLGFIEHLCDDFGTGETFRVLWHADGILATVESYRGGGLNSAKILYNVRVSGDDWHSRISSGSRHGDVWVGDHDAREGVRNSIARWREVGEFLPTWEQRPFLWLLTYEDSKVEGYDHEAITAERVSRLPEHVQAAIAGGAS